MTGASPEPDHFKDREGPEDHESQDQELTSEADQPADQGDQEEVTEGADVLLDLPVEGSEGLCFTFKLFSLVINLDTFGIFSYQSINSLIKNWTKLPTIWIS